MFCFCNWVFMVVKSCFFVILGFDGILMVLRMVIVKFLVVYGLGVLMFRSGCMIFLYLLFLGWNFGIRLKW